MTSTDPDLPADQLIELDDVEGHGLREVAAGLGAAAVLAGGGAGLASAASTGPAVHPSLGHPTATVSTTAGSVTVDPVGVTDRLTDQALHDARGARDAALATATGTAGRAAQAVGGTEAAALRTAAGTVRSATSLATSEVSSATRLATGTEQSTESTAHATTTPVVTAARNDVSSTTATADRKVATVLQVVTTTTATGLHTATMTLQATSAGAGVDVLDATGWVLVKAGDQVLAQVQMSHGTAVASWTMPAAGAGALTISYTGDSSFAPALRTVSL